MASYVSQPPLLCSGSVGVGREWVASTTWNMYALATYRKLMSFLISLSILTFPPEILVLKFETPISSSTSVLHVLLKVSIDQKVHTYCPLVSIPPELPIPAKDTTVCQHAVFLLTACDQSAMNACLFIIPNAWSAWEHCHCFPFQCAQARARKFLSRKYYRIIAVGASLSWEIDLLLRCRHAFQVKVWKW